MKKTPRSRFIFLILLALSVHLGALSLTRAQESAEGPHVKVRWLAPTTLATSGSAMGFHFALEPGWHVYWKNPGDSGAAPKFVFSPESARVGPMQWPAPQRLPVAHLTNFGYSDEVVYWFRVQPNHAGKVKLEANLEWLVCKEECIPGFAKLSLSRIADSEGGERWQSKDKALLAKFQQRTPDANVPNPWKVVKAEILAGHLKITLQHSVPLADSLEYEVFPANAEWLQTGPVTYTRSESSLLTAKIPIQSTALAANMKSHLLVTSAVGVHELSDVQVSSSTSLTAAATATTESLWLLLLSALLGGILLNLMPCVFPVLSIKILSLLKSGSAPTQARLQDSSAYAAGVLFTFVGLGLIFLLLREAGASIGWGFQLQQPGIVLALAVLFWLMGLNFLGAFHFGDSVANFFGRRESPSSSFATGVLAVFVAAPCTGPFMGAALGAATTLSAPAALSIFASLGFGLALPYVALSLWPGLLRFLPKPGAWMETLKQFLAFPLFATVLWLLWVLTQQTDANFGLQASGILLVLSFCVWLANRSRRPGKIAASFVAVAVLLFTFTNLPKTESKAPLANDKGWAPYSATDISKARLNNQAVFVDFTAAWCITCQVNKQVVLNTTATQKIFQSQNVKLIRADWTQQDPEITKALAEFSRNSVPLYVFYPRGGGEPLILPQILSQSMIENLFSKTMEASQ